MPNPAFVGKDSKVNFGLDIEVNRLTGQRMKKTALLARELRIGEIATQPRRSFESGPGRSCLL
jgi:hypothetical protein